MVTDEKVLNMHEELVDCTLIDLLPVDKATRSFSKDFAKNLSVSLKAEGLYNPIAVRPNPEKPGRYILVQGRHRLYAWFRLLKEKMIRATILTAMDEREAAMAAAAENIWRWDGGKAQKIRALKIWYDYYAEKHGLAVEAKSADATDARTIEAFVIEASNPAPEVEPEATPAIKKSKAVEQTFVKQVAKATGTSERTAQRDVRLAKLFSAETLDLFVQRGITQQQIGMVSQIAEADKQVELVNLLASGMEFNEAWLRIFNTPADLSGGTKDEKEAKTAAKAENDQPLSDEEWLNTYCGEKLSLLGHPEKFRADAILYRHTTDLRAKFRSRIKSHLKETADAGVKGPLWGSISRLIGLSHPKDFHNCPECGGAGEVNGAVCRKCNGAGYILKSEKFE